MIIAIDGYEANVANRVGIGRYAYELLVHMYKRVQGLGVRGQDGVQNFKFRIYLPSNPLPDMPPATEWWEYRVLVPAKLWTFIALPMALMRDMPQASVVFSPTHYIPRFIALPRVMSIMDLSYLKFPELFRKKDLHQLTNWTKYSARHAAKIFTISDYSRNDIIKTYHVAPEDVVVTYPGLTMQATSIPEKSLDIGKYYILSVGTLQPRKNFVRLIEAFAQFLQKNKQKFGAVELVIVGKKGWLYDEILAAPAHFGVAKNVRFLDFVPDSALPSLYKNALCFALPSLYEGFGLPVLEAMSYGCPVVVSDVSSLPEIAGKAGIYVNPEDTQSITGGLLQAVRERNLVQGKTRVKAGLEQVKQFTWEKAAKQTLAVLEDVGKGKGV